MATVMSISAAPNLRFSPVATVMTVGVANLVEQGLESRVAGLLRVLAILFYAKLLL